MLKLAVVGVNLRHSGKFPVVLALKQERDQHRCLDHEVIVVVYSNYGGSKFNIPEEGTMTRRISHRSHFPFYYVTSAGFQYKYSNVLVLGQTRRKNAPRSST